MSDISFHGDLDTPGSYRADDLKKFRDPVWTGRVKKLFANSPYPFNVYVVNGDAAGHVADTRENGAINAFDRNLSGWQSWDWARSVLGRVPESARRNVNIIMMHNEGDDRVGLTPWIMAHRIGHAFFERSNRLVNRDLQVAAGNIGNKVINALERVIFPLLPDSFLTDEDRIATNNFKASARLISPFRSARTGTVRSAGEYVLELFAQFIITGKVTFNRVEIDGSAQVPVTVVPTEEDIFEETYRRLYRYHIRFEDGGDEDGSALEEVLDQLVFDLKSVKVKPKSKAAIKKLYHKWAGEGLYDEPTQNGTTKLFAALDTLEAFLNKEFDAIVTKHIGQFLILT